MAIDLYALCPCGSGKKIKFCCRDLAGEIEKIERMIEAGQRQACLEHIELLEKKYANRVYLLARKAELQRELGREAEADGTLKALLDQEQQNPVALAELALLALAKEDKVDVQQVPAAIEHLQRALEVSPRDPWPDKVKEALAAVADECFAAGYEPACLAHTVLFLEAEPDNEGAMHALSHFASSARVPLPFKELRPFHKCPEGAPWRDEFQAAMALADHGLWLRAEEQLTALAEKAASVPAIWHNLAVLRMWLAKDQEAVAALRKLAGLDIPLDDAAEAEALALQLDATPLMEHVEVSHLTYPVRDMEKVIATVCTDRRCVDYPMTITQSEEQAPPRSTHLVLDRPEPEPPAELTPDSVPLVTGFLFVYGKETDREARLEFHLSKSDRFVADQARLAEMFGDAVGPPEEHADGEQAISPLRDRAEPYYPLTTPVDLRYDLQIDRQRRYCFEEWPQQPRSFLDGKTPEQAVSDPQGRVRLLGMLLFVELGSQREKTADFDFDALRRRLGLAEPTPIEPDGQAVADVPLARLVRLRMEKLSDEDLFRVFIRAANYRAAAAAQKAALELISRASLAARHAAQATMYNTLAHLTPDTRRAVEYIDQARRFAEAAGKSSAEYDIQEMLVRIRRGEGQHFSRLMDHLLQEHVDEPGVRQALREVLASLGMIQPDGTMPSHMEPEAVAAAADESPARESPTLWTPDSAASPTSGDKPRILLSS